MEAEDKLKEVDLMDYWRVIVRRKWIVVALAGALVIITGIFSFLATPIYKSSATLLIEEESSRILSIDEAFSNQPRVIQDLRNYNTQLKLLLSRSLAEQVAKKLNLPSRPEFGAGKKPKKNLLAGIRYILTFRWISPGRSTKRNDGDPSTPENPYSGIANYLLAGIEVSPVRDTKLIELSFKFPSPVLATEIVNTIAEEFINFSIEKRYSTTRQASDFLDDQIADLRDEIAAKERELQRYGQEKDILFLSESESQAVSAFATLNEAYNQARLDRINAEAEYREIRNLEGDAVPQFISDPAIQQIKTEYTRLRAQYEEKRGQLKADHPEMMRIQSRLNSLKDEIDRAADAAEAKYKAALNKEGSIRATLDRQRGDVAKMNSNAIFYNNLKIEVESKRKQLNTLSEKRDQTKLSAQLRGLNASNISIIDPADVPMRPVTPNKKKNLLLALIIGLVGGVGLCFIFDYLDDTIKGPDDVEKLANLPSLGVIPYLDPEGSRKGKKYSGYFKPPYGYAKENPEKEHTLPEVKEIELVNHLYPGLPLSEDYRSVRTSILLSHAEKPPKSIVFTSALTQEGKTATVVNLAISFAQLQERVLVIDADLRKPRLHRLLKLRNLNGLTGFLTGKLPLKEIIQKTFIENLWLVPSGPIPPNPAELLNSNKMKDMLEEASQVFDVVFMDSPPVLAVIDPVIMSSIAESTVLVVRGGKTRRKPLLGAVEELKRARANIIGVVFNGVNLSKEGSYYTKHYRYYEYGSYGKEDQEIPRDML
jgi:capsular exopolysaccharide synthesis family protein